MYAVNHHLVLTKTEAAQTVEKINHLSKSVDILIGQRNGYYKRWQKAENLLCACAFDQGVREQEMDDAITSHYRRARLVDGLRADDAEIEKQGSKDDERME